MASQVTSEASLDLATTAAPCSPDAVASAVGDARQAVVRTSARLAGLDVIRGVACLAITWYHLTDGYAEDSLLRASGHWGWTSLAAFFVISGFVIPYAMHRGGYDLRRNWATFLCKRILRIDPPYLIAALVALVLGYASAAAPGFQGQAPNYSPAQVFLHLGYLNEIAGYPWLNPVFWTLAIEFQYYLLISLVFGLLSSNRWQLRWPVVVAFIAAPFLFEGNVYVFQFLSMFMFGIVLFQYRTDVIGRLEAGIVLALVSVSVYFNMGWAYMTVGLATTAVILANWDFGRPRLLIFLGSISYSLYLLHVPIGGRVVNLGLRYVESETGEWLVTGLALLVSLVSATLFWHWVERPALRWASRIKYRSSDVA